MIALFIISILALFGYYRLIYFYARSWNQLQAVDPGFESAVTVIVPFRNEIQALPKLLGSFAEINYPSNALEFLFINDGSSDGSVELVESFEFPFKKRVISLEEGAGKKDAVRRAWGEVSSEIIIHTDADCEVGKDWVRTMITPFSDPSVHFVSGPVNYYSSDSFFQEWLKLDFASLISIGAAHIKWGRPLICNGANLAFRADKLAEIDLKDAIASGDDVFLMHSIHQKSEGSVYFQKHKEATVMTSGPASFGEFIHQRLRWAGKNTGYEDKINTSMLAFSWLFNVIIVLDLGMFNSVSVLLAMLMIITKVLIESRLYRDIADFFELKDWYRVLMYGQLFHIIYMVSLPIASKIVKYKWKGRKLR